MKTIFGIRSAMPINKKLKNGHMMYDWVVRQKGFPVFCLRSLCGENQLSSEEMDFLKGKDCKIGFVLDDLTERAVSRLNGVEDALRAVEAAQNLGVPQDAGIAIFAEIQPDWSVNHNWMISFAQVIAGNGYVPGFIGNTDSSKNFNFDRQCSHFVEATVDVDGFKAVYAATEPKLDNVPESWEPYCPSVLEPEDMSFWVCGETTFGDVVVGDVYAQNESVLAKLW